MNFRRHYEDLVEDTLRVMGRGEIQFMVREPSNGVSETDPSAPQGYIKASREPIGIGDLGVTLWVSMKQVGLEGNAVIACFPWWKHLDGYTDAEVADGIIEAVGAIDAQARARKEVLAANG